MRQSVESDIHEICKFVYVTWLQPETEIKAVKEELLFMEKNHEEEVKDLQAQIASCGLIMEADAPRSQDISKIRADIQSQYDKLAQKNREELDKYWSQQIEEGTRVVTTRSTWAQYLKASLENSLRVVEVRYTMEMEQLNGVLLHLESELAQTQTEGQHQAQEYEALMNIKVKLETEITTYHCLLEDREDFILSDALDSSNSKQTIQKTTRLVDGKVGSETNDGKVGSETNDTKVLRH
ncbi:hypothetical protein H8959_003988 [Pygathrix nigripes]